MRTLGVRRQYQDVRLSDDPDSPTFRIDLTDSNLRGWMQAWNGAVADMAEAGYTEDMGLDALTPELSLAMANAFKAVITAVTGAAKYDEILGWVGGGAAAEDCTLSMADVFGAIGDVLMEQMAALNERNKAAADKYLRRDAVADGQ
jgi:hypothetical protein